jgi:peptide/bleomycin uptake transporter
LFKSFFPKPFPFFVSLLVWSLFGILSWYFGGDALGANFGLPPAAENTPPAIGLAFFVTPAFLWFYIYFGFFAGAFGLFWQIYARDQIWRTWSIWGSTFILFSTYYSVQVSVALNEWRRPFFDLVQTALSGPGKVKPEELYHLLLIFCEIAFIWTVVYVVTRFVVSHYVFRWRTAMNNFYLDQWPKVRSIEGASQRIQEDTMRFAQISEDLGVSLIDSVMTLIAFLPLLYGLSNTVTELPLVGAIPSPLFTAAIFWSLFGTVLLAVVGIKLPGLNFLNQRVEAAFRKELVYGEDDITRAQPPTVAQLFADVRKNYFRLYFHYLYFNVARSFYLQADNVFAYVILVPTIAAGKITFGLLQQILTAFGQVSSSFQYLVNSWTTIIELQSIYKRLRTFEAAIDNLPLSEIEVDYVVEISNGE